jgi:hypothetical protein
MRAEFVIKEKMTTKSVLVIAKVLEGGGESRDA